ncbi:hypothetical protein TNCV_1112351 [Trichonephila clavipes]|uniref:Mutator-like transposase domain-containing protein n=1 Tax=Trichonephila clavipes TaxID=2585209 RepID=A0A8X6UYA4_TRICX|nr:hypothetical protein TNCV_1112351 [Trichonephila clavipes]
MHDPWAFDLVPCSQPPVGVKQSESRLITECYSFPNFYTPVFFALLPRQGVEDSMNAAVHEAVIANDNNSNIAVAVDGTWHKRGYSSLNGVVCATSVENGKVIDFEALHKILFFIDLKHHEKHVICLGDGDSKGFLTIKEAKVYGDTELKIRNVLAMCKSVWAQG